ncbi:hypothetical protein KU43P_03340 [Pseudomonas sp. KU43P]|nr:hypothetical protein KU43P_03340 [Pseudomonas sp. KU43P]
MTRIGMPRREESELTRMLAPTSNAPIKNRLLMVLASKGRYSGTSRGEGTCENELAGRVPIDSNLMNWQAVKRFCRCAKGTRVGAFSGVAWLGLIAGKPAPTG